MKKRKKWLSLVLMVLIFTQVPAAAYAAEKKMDEDVTLAPYFLVEGEDTANDSFPLKETKVSTMIHGVFAETYVTQIYTNGGSNPLNASYVFPASEKVAVHGMTMTIGDRLITAQIQEKEEARQEYEQAKSEGKSASLLEQQRPNVFTMDVANVMPGDTIAIELHYSELITPTDGSYQFVFPTVVGPRYAGPVSAGTAADNQWVASPYQKADTTASGKYEIAVNLAAAVPIRELTSKSHEVSVAWDGETNALVTLANPEDFAGNRDFILDYQLTGEDVASGLLLGKGEEENFFMLMVQPPKRFAPEEIPPREYIFVVDVSGSMYGFPLNTAKVLIRNLVTSLQETDTFNVLLFSGASVLMSPESVPATKENIKHAIDFVENEDGGGWTELAAALETAIAIPRHPTMTRSIVVITDGYIEAEKETFELISSHLDTTNFFSFGIGSSVNRYLIDGVAKAGQGESFIVTDADDAIRTAERFRTYIQSPLLTDVQVIYDGFTVYDIEPAGVPTLFAQKPIVIYGKWQGEPTGTIKITGQSGSQNYTKEIRVSETIPLEDNNGIQYLWARSKVESLTDYGNSQGNDDDIKKEITEIGLKYSLMTPHTSFIAVLNVIRNQDGNSTDVNQPLPLPEGVSKLAVGGYTVGSEPGDILLLFTLAAIIATILLPVHKKTVRRKRF